MLIHFIQKTGNTIEKKNEFLKKYMDL
uniref:Uncharacterized protein n=1 Tax=Anguilla anguilla TaxID=7936 RepID=A0A0E9QHJ8_ANGAN